MSAEVLRRAASLMRERADATVVVYSATGEEVPWHSEAVLEVDWDREDAAHIAAWSPTVALAVADSLDQAAAVIEEAGSGPLAMAMSAIAEPLVTVARAYLGES